MTGILNLKKLFFHNFFSSNHFILDILMKSLTAKLWKIKIYNIMIQKCGILFQANYILVGLKKIRWK